MPASIAAVPTKGRPEKIASVNAPESTAVRRREGGIFSLCSVGASLNRL